MENLCDIQVHGFIQFAALARRRDKALSRAHDQTNRKENGDGSNAKARRPGCNAVTLATMKGARKLVARPCQRVDAEVPPSLILR
jgi:hypothetical protein